MSGSDTWKCGHDRSPENTYHSGAIKSCRECREAMWARQRQQTAERNANIVAAYKGGDSIEAVARRYKVSSLHIQNVLRREGAMAEIPYAGDPLFPQRAMAVAARLAGASVEQLRSAWRSPKELVRARWALAVAMRKRGASTVQIGRRLNRDHSTVLYSLRQADVYAARCEEFAAMLAEVDAA